MRACSCLILSVCALVVGCSGDIGAVRPNGQTGFQVKGTNAIYAASALPYDVTRGTLEPLYFGQNVVRALGARGDFSGNVGGDSGEPQGAVIAIWFSGEVRETAQDGWPIFTHKRHYYAAALPSQIASFPAKIAGHRYYGVYVSAGKVVVSDKGLRTEDVPGAIAYTTGKTKVPRYAFGREDTLYYKILSRNEESPSVVDDSSAWNTLPGVELTEAQYVELSMCSPSTMTGSNGEPCRVFLSESDPDLTPEQRDYVKHHPITRRDIRPLIKRMQRLDRSQDRWQ